MCRRYIISVTPDKKISDFRSLGTANHTVTASQRDATLIEHRFTLSFNRHIKAHSFVASLHECENATFFLNPRKKTLRQCRR